MNEPILLTLLLAVALVAGFAVVALALAVRRLGRRCIGQEQALRTMQQDLRALVNAAVTVGERVNRLEQQSRDIIARQEDLGIRQDRLDQGAGDERSYDQAVKMVKKGASVEDLIEVCGLARGEAELIAMMHRLSV